MLEYIYIGIGCLFVLGVSIKVIEGAYISFKQSIADRRYHKREILVKDFMAEVEQRSGAEFPMLIEVFSAVNKIIDGSFDAHTPQTFHDRLLSLRNDKKLYGWPFN